MKLYFLKKSKKFYHPFEPLLKLGMPIIGTRLCGAFLNVLPMWMLAKLSEEYMAVGALISSVITVVMMVSISLVSPTGIFVARAFGAKRFSDIGTYIKSSLIIGFIVGVPAVLVLRNIGNILLFLGQEKNLTLLAESYLKYFSIGVIPSLWFVTFIQFAIGTSKPKLVIFWSILCIALMIILSYLLTSGKFFFLKEGAPGIGLANGIMYWLICIVIVIHLIIRKDDKKFHLFADWNKVNILEIKKMFMFGLSVSMQVLAEFSALFFSTIIIGKFGEAALVSRQIQLQVSSLVLMIPYGLSQANMILISQELGAGESSENTLRKIRHIFYSTLGLVSLFSVIIAFLFFFSPMWIINLFESQTDQLNETVIYTTKLFLKLAAFFYFFDMFRIIAVGSLRSLHDSLASLYVSLILNFIIALLLGYFLSFYTSFGVTGMLASFVSINLVGSVILIKRFQAFTKDNTGWSQVSRNSPVLGLSP